MQKKKKVSKAEAKASIARIHEASKSKKKLHFKAPEPSAVHEVPPQAEKEVVEIPAAHIEVKAPAASKEETPIELPVEEEVEEEPEEKPKKKSDGIVIGDSIEFGWNSVKSRLWFFIGIFFLFAALSAMAAYASGIGTRIVLGILIFGISIGYFKLAVDIVDGKAPEFKELFSCFSLLLKYLVASIIYKIVVIIGLVLFIIPGLIWGVQFGFYPFILVKERLGPIKALRKSSAITEGVKGKLIFFALTLFGINLLGLIALGIGIIVTIPLSVITVAHMFSQLEKRS
jgi:hypothetical protein